MPTKHDLDLHITAHLQSLSTLRRGVPSGLPEQFAQLSAILTTYDVELCQRSPKTAQIWTLVGSPRLSLT